MNAYLVTGGDSGQQMRPVWQGGKEKIWADTVLPKRTPEKAGMQVSGAEDRRKSLGHVPGKLGKRQGLGTQVGQ